MNINLPSPYFEPKYFRQDGEETDGRGNIHLSTPVEPGRYEVCIQGQLPAGATIDFRRDWDKVVKESITETSVSTFVHNRFVTVITPKDQPFLLCNFSGTVSNCCVILTRLSYPLGWSRIDTELITLLSITFPKMPIDRSVNYATLSEERRQLCYDDFSTKFALIKSRFPELPLPEFDRTGPLEYHDTMYKTCIRYLEAMDQYRRQQIRSIVDFFGVPRPVNAKQ